MIAYLEGTILKKNQRTLIVKNNGLGYLVHVPLPLFENLEIGQQVELFIYTKVREDDISLFGFGHSDQLEFFKDLINVNGIGPKLALEILSSNIEKTKKAILQEDVHHLSKIPGIGKKTAERIIVELKNKIIPGEISETAMASEQRNLEDAMNALLNLGYQKFEVMRILKTIPEEINDPEEIITYFLKNA